ncbi:hypothetical protein [Deinococcus hopiensis]|uniref:Uncharacterized protein n=1 Tax=Deinococcus hopiensis KR-140 TaxID=695939 RepID=A0A1W1URA8_9DEIO|nr:hypothetical protein [Deinococcus hopiensis]SMB83341.1 hypothetical protein SAMN00790413_04372 [Deinococcus hopiensis KR-140]
MYLPLPPVPGTGVWPVTAQIKDITHAALSLRTGVAGPPSPPQAHTAWRGTQAPAAIPSTQILSGKIDWFILKSGSLPGSREITVYTPPNWTKAGGLPAVYLGDGAMVLGLARFPTSGGTLELPYLEAARRYTALSSSAGQPACLVTLVGEHDALLWEEVFPTGGAFTLDR